MMHFRDVLLCAAVMVSAAPCSWAESSLKADAPALSPFEQHPSAAIMKKSIAVSGAFSREVNIAIARDYQLRQLYEQWQSASDDIDDVKGERWPQLHVSAVAMPVSEGNGRYKRYANDGDFSASLSMPVFDWGRLASAIKNREYRNVAAAQKYLSQLDELAFDVTSTEVKLGKQRAILQTAQVYSSRMEELVTMLSRIVETDAGRQSELVQAQARLLQAEEARDDAAAEIETLTVTLNQWLGDAPRHPIPIDSLWDMQMPDANSALSNLQATPMMREAQAQYQAWLASAKEEKAKQLPQLDLVANKGFAAANYGEESDLQVGFSISWDIFSGFSGMAKVSSAIHSAEAYKQAREDLLRRTEYRVKTQYREVEKYSKRATAYANLAVESDKIRWMFFQQWYHLGKRSLLDVLIAETDHYNNQVNAISSRFDAWYNILSIRKDAGLLLPWLDEAGKAS